MKVERHNNRVNFANGGYFRQQHKFCDRLPTIESKKVSQNSKTSTEEIFIIFTYRSNLLPYSFHRQFWYHKFKVGIFRKWDELIVSLSFTHEIKSMAIGMLNVCRWYLLWQFGATTFKSGEQLLRGLQQRNKWGEKRKVWDLGFSGKLKYVYILMFFLKYKYFNVHCCYMSLE